MLSIQRKVAVRELDLDVAIDLSGWTSGHFLGGFLASWLLFNVAMVFCIHWDSGDRFWLGDWSLFPKEYEGWHTETLWRLDRPFLAWQPVDPLPEASRCDVCSLRPHSFRFFQSQPQLSDKLLGFEKILESVPDSILVLKASTASDMATQQLLRRRMLRVGLNPERIKWIPLTIGLQSI